MDIIEVLDGTQKAGNVSQLKSKMIIIDMERETIIQRYDVEVVDADGDVLKTETSEQVILSGDNFPLWVTEAVEAATRETIKNDYESKLESVEEDS